MMALFVVVSFILTILFLLLNIIKRKYRYWKTQNVIQPKPTIIFGNYGDYFLMKKCLGVTLDDICKNYPSEAYIGTYYGTEPALIVKDPELIKLITTKDFYYFSGREINRHSHREPFTKNLFFTFGDRWKILRQNLTPIFTSTKMKNMFHLIEKCSNEFEKMLDIGYKTSPTQDIKTMWSRYTMDCIGACVFGVDTNTMKNNKNEFSKIGDLIFQVSTLRGIAISMRSAWPSLFYGLGLRAFPKQLDDFFTNLTTAVFKTRNYKPSPRKDFVDLFLELLNNKSISGDSINNLKNKDEKIKVDIEIDDDFITSNCILFFGAGYETSSTTLSFVLYELAKDQKSQSRAVEEVDKFFEKESKMDYNRCMTELPYIEACINETLRLYPVLAGLTREVEENYILPTGLKLEKGLRIHIPVYHLHKNPEYFPEPETFRPERFYGDEKKNIKPYTFMPFGEGPRICIGSRFAKMQMFAGLATFFKKFRVELADDMQSSVNFEPKLLVTQPVGGIRLKLIPRNQQRFCERN